MKILKKLAIGAAALALVGGAQAVSISSYDVTGAQLSGFGFWSHTYSGSIVGNTYSGGSGTLNDGIIPTSEQNNQLFLMADAPTITLHLNALTTLSSIEIFGGNVGSSNLVAGTLTGWSVTIGANTVALGSTDFGPSCFSGLCNDRVNLVGTGLDLLATNSVTLSGFTGGWFGSFNAGEITVDGAAAMPVPEPETFALMLAGLGVVATMARRRRSVR